MKINNRKKFSTIKLVNRRQNKILQRDKEREAERQRERVKSRKREKKLNRDLQTMELKIGEGCGIKHKDFHY